MIGERILQARRGAGLSLRALAKLMGGYVTAQAIQKYETGKNTPGSDVLIKLSAALGVKRDYFLRPAVRSVDLTEPTFRKRSTTSKKEQGSIRARTNRWVEAYLEVESLFPPDRFAKNRLPRPDDRVISRLEDVEGVAESVRRRWNLGSDPIEQLCEVLEDRGVKVMMVDTSAAIDGLSCWANETLPVLVVKKNQASDRIRFSIVHELGHLLLKCSHSVNPEKAANRFAGAFLIPQEAARRELGEHRQSLSLFELSSLRAKYGLSVQAWIYRARDLAIISESLFVRWFRVLKTNGGYARELGNPIAVAEPQRFERLVVQAAVEDLISPARGAEVLEISLMEFRKRLAPGGSDADIRS